MMKSWSEANDTNFVGEALYELINIFLDIEWDLQDIEKPITDK